MERFIIDNPDKTVTACSLINTTPVGLFVPTNWSFDQYASLRKINQEELSQSELLGDSSVHKIQDKKTLENLYIGRTSLSASKDHPLQ